MNDNFSLVRLCESKVWFHLLLFAVGLTHSSESVSTITGFSLV